MTKTATSTTSATVAWILIASLLVATATAATAAFAWGSRQPSRIAHTVWLPSPQSVERPANEDHP